MYSCSAALVPNVLMFSCSGTQFTHVQLLWYPIYYPKGTKAESRNQYTTAAHMHIKLLVNFVLGTIYKKYHTDGKYLTSWIFPTRFPRRIPVKAVQPSSQIRRLCGWADGFTTNNMIRMLLRLIHLLYIYIGYILLRVERVNAVLFTYLFYLLTFL